MKLKGWNSIWNETKLFEWYKVLQEELQLKILIFESTPLNNSETKKENIYKNLLLIHLNLLKSEITNSAVHFLAVLLFLVINYW